MVANKVKSLQAQVGIALTAVEEVSAVQQNDLVILKAKEEAGKNFHTNVSSMLKDIQKNNELGIVLYYSKDLSITVRCRCKDTKQKTFERIKTEKSRKNL